MKHEDKKHFDVSRPSRHGPDPTSKPIIVGHHPTMPDPMIREEREKTARSIVVTSDSDEAEPLNSPQPEAEAGEPAKADGLPDLSDLSAPHETSPALTPSVKINPDSEPAPGAVFTGSGSILTAGTAAAEAKSDEVLTPASTVEPPPSTPSEPPVGQELHIPAGHGHAAVHHKPRAWVWVVVGLIILVWVYAAVDALTDTKLPIEFFKKSGTVTLQPIITPPTSEVTAEPYANWETYTSNAGNFSLRYPASWLIEGFRDELPVFTEGAQTQGTTSIINGDENLIRLTEETDNNGFTLVISIEPGLDKLQYDADNQVSGGTSSKLSNGLTLWQSNQSSRFKSDCSAYPSLNLVSENKFYYMLASSKYLGIQGNFCYGQKAKTSYTYQQQVDSQAWQEAIKIIESISFN